MSENLARCRRCHDVFDPEAGFCPRCGTPYQPIAAPPSPDDGTYADRYANTEFTAPVATSDVRPRSGPSMGMLLAGAGLLVAALLVVTLAAAGAFSAPAGTPPIIISLAPTGTPTPSPTVRPELVMTLQALNDPAINAHLVISTRIDIDSSIKGHPSSNVATYDLQLSSGETQGIFTAGGQSTEVRFVDGTYYVRTLPKGKWTATSHVSAFFSVLPLFDVKNSNMLAYVGEEEYDGQQTYHLQSTRMWVPDLNKMSMTDANAIGIKPDTVALDLWVSTFGKPVYATFSGTTLAYDGKKLLDIETTFTFSDVGTPVDVINPLATPTPKPTPTPTPTPTS